MKHDPVESSSIESLAYDHPKQMMEVRFKGGKIYTHHGVTVEEFERLRTASSVGSEYRAKFYGKHAGTGV